MTQATHWSFYEYPEDWTDDPDTSPLAAAESIIRDGNSDDSALWQIRDDICHGQTADIQLFGFIHTGEIIADEDERFDGYEPGCEFYKSTGETVTVRVSLQVEVVQ